MTEQISSAQAQPGTHKGQPIGTREFILMMAALMAMNALSIDPMLPALPDIGRDLDVAHPNDRQMLITVYFAGFGLGSLFYGPLSDRYGRRPVLLISIAMFVAATAMCALSPSFAVILAARLASGFFASSTRVVVTGIVRDRFHGDRMASVMSLIFIIFMVVPIVAPSYGQLVLTVAPWRWIFWSLAFTGCAIWLWVLRRLPETLTPENRVGIGVSSLLRTFREVVTHRVAIGHMVASGVVMAGLVGFITSVQQIFFDVFDARAIFPFAFAGIAIWMAVGSFFNSRLVIQVVARRMSQGALIALTMLSALHSLLIWRGHETLPMFMLFQSATMLCFAFAGANFSAISLEPFGRGAGLASSLQSALSSLLAALLGSAIGSSFDGTTLPLSLGFLIFSMAALLIVAWAENWRLFRRPGLSHLREPSPPR